MSEKSVADTSSVLYDAGEKAGAMVASIWNATDDGKISKTEWLSIAGKIAVVLFGIFSDREDIGSLLADGLDEQESLDWNTGFSVGFDITSDTTETTVETVAGYILKAAVYLYLAFAKKTADEGEDEEETTSDETA